VAADIVRKPDGRVVIRDPETGQEIEVQPDLAEAIEDAARKNPEAVRIITDMLEGANAKGDDPATAKERLAALNAAIDRAFPTDDPKNRLNRTLNRRFKTSVRQALNDPDKALDLAGLLLRQIDPASMGEMLAATAEGFGVMIAPALVLEAAGTVVARQLVSMYLRHLTLSTLRDAARRPHGDLSGQEQEEAESATDDETRDETDEFGQKPQSPPPDTELDQKVTRQTGDDEVDGLLRRDGVVIQRRFDALDKRTWATKKKVSARKLNDEFVQKHRRRNANNPNAKPPELPHDPDAPALTVTHKVSETNPLDLVRVFPEDGKVTGGWLMLREDFDRIRRLPNAAEIFKELLALEKTPKFFNRLQPPPGASFEMNISFVGKNKWGPGGGVQFQPCPKIADEWFVKEQIPIAGAGK
jgi:hypothetical protein